MRAFLFLIVLVGCSHKINIVAPAENLSRAQYEAFGKNAMVTSQGEATSRASLATLANGGNIIDAFVTASFMISVERPQSTGIGGGGCALPISIFKKKTKYTLLTFGKLHLFYQNLECF